jgi:hypothetical protein
MNINSNYGYVTFADILGWKGIWQNNKQSNPVHSLLQIRSELKEYISVLQSRYYKHLINNELSMYFEDDKRNELLKEIIKQSSNFELLIAAYSKDENKVLNELSNFKIEIAIELISDTFVITSSGQDIIYETILHSLMAQSIVNACLKKGFLIRGATSYGEYYKQELVFVGPAIDDSASWHEMGEEIGIFFTPKALLTIEDKCVEVNSIAINNIKLKDVIFLEKPRLKVQSFETYLVNWSGASEFFKQIICNYSTILPDIHKKILFSKERLDKMEKL